MPLPDQIPRSWRADLRAMLRIGVPLALSELGWMAMSVVDNIMVGGLPESAAAIGAASVGGALFYGVAIFGLGLMSGLDTLVSQAFGAEDWPEARRSLASGLTIALLSAPLLVGIIYAATPLLALIGVQNPVRDQAVAFIKVLIWSLPPLQIYTTFRRYLQGIHYVRPVVFGLVTANLVNLLGNWILIFGNWGAPAMGVRGSALSTVIARIFLMAVMVAGVALRDPAALRFPRPDFAHVRRLLALGAPAAMTIGLEVGVFNLCTALIGTLDPVSLAAHTIALNAAAVTYMVPLGLGSAAAVSVGRHIGAGDPRGAARAGWTAIALTVAFECVSGLTFLLIPDRISAAYTRDARVISFAGTLFIIAAVFQIFDGLQTVATGALRGLGNTRTPMVFNLVGYWALALPLGAWWCFRLGWGAVGLWYGLCLALILIGLGLTWVWHRSTGQSHSTV
jgi:MATE family multidrug resistance protein